MVIMLFVLIVDLLLVLLWVSEESLVWNSVNINMADHTL